MIPGTSCFHGNWVEDARAGQFIIFGDFVGRCLVCRCTYLCGSVADVSGTVTSQAIGLPLDHGISVLPSGRFPFCRINFAGSFVAGICARFTDLRRMSFMQLYRCCLGELLLLLLSLQHQKPPRQRDHPK